MADGIWCEVLRIIYRKEFFAELNSLCLVPRIGRVAVRRESAGTAWIPWIALIQSRTKKYCIPCTKEDRTRQSLYNKRCNSSLAPPILNQIETKAVQGA